MKFIELLFEKLNGWMEPFPDKTRARQKVFALVVWLVFLTFLAIIIITMSGR